MKTLKFSNLKFILSALVILFGVFVISSCKKDKDKPDNRPYTLSGNASGTQVVPSVTGSGAGTFTGTYDPATGTMNYTTNWTDLTGAPTSGGFYTGASGAAGTAVGDPWVMGTDWTGTDTLRHRSSICAVIVTTKAEFI